MTGPDLPEWLRPVEAGTRSITVHDLTRFMPPEDSDPRLGAVLMLFGEGPEGPDLLLTERAHHMRSHPGQVSFPGGSIDPDETAVQAAIREAEEETGLDPSGWIGPGFLIGDDKDVICWGFTAGIISRLFEFLGWAEQVDDPPLHDLPSYMLAGDPVNTDFETNTEFDERRR